MGRRRRRRFRNRSQRMRSRGSTRCTGRMLTCSLFSGFIYPCKYLGLSIDSVLSDVGATFYIIHIDERRRHLFHGTFNCQDHWTSDRISGTAMARNIYYSSGNGQHRWTPVLVCNKLRDFLFGKLSYILNYFKWNGAEIWWAFSLVYIFVHGVWIRC